MTNSTGPDESDARVLDIAIIGAGIGGASAAVALRQAGFDVHVFEQTRELREVGGAILLREPSLALLKAWGLSKAFLQVAVPVERMEHFDREGKALGWTPVRVSEDEGDAAYSVHRADVHSMLVETIPKDRLHLGRRLVSVRSEAEVAEASFEDGSHVRARLIVGADGLRSVVRTLTDHSELAFRGQITHRTVAPASSLPEHLQNDRLRLWRHEKRSVILMPIRGGREFALDAVIFQDEPPGELWSSAPVEQLLEAYHDFDPLLLRALRERIADVTTHPVYDKEPLSTWVEGRTVLLGDAAHPMAPMQGQGANTAIQDAGALASALAGTEPSKWGDALSRYQSERAPITAKIQKLSREVPKTELRPLA